MAKCVITDAPVRVHVAALFLMNYFTGKKPERWTVASECVHTLTTAVQLLGVNQERLWVNSVISPICLSVCLSFEFCYIMNGQTNTVTMRLCQEITYDLLRYC